MSSDIILRIASVPSDPDGNLQVRYENTVNSPIVSVTYMDSGAAIADDYTLVITKTGAVYTCTVNCTTKNPYRDMVGAVVVCDGSTPNYDIIPGLGIVFSASADTGWTGVVSIGNSMDGSAVVTDVLALDVIEAGTSTTGVRVAAVNVGGDNSEQTVVYALPGLYYYGTTDWRKVAKKIAPHTETAYHKSAVAGTYVLTFTDYKWNGTLGCYTVDVYVGANKAIEDARLNGTAVHEYGDGIGYIDGGNYLPGLSIIFQNNPGDITSDTFTIKVTTDHAWVEFAADISGSPGAYSHQDLTLTESGETAGTITPSGVAYFWVRATLPAAASAGDMRKGVVRVRGLTT